MREKDTCGMYQIYFFVNLLKPLETIEIINDKKPKKKQWKIIKRNSNNSQRRK